jgi:hypothetical protein
VYRSLTLDENDRWEMRAEGPNEFERSYTFGHKCWSTPAGSDRESALAALPAKATEVSRVSLALAHDSTEVRTNTGAETHI